MNADTSDHLTARFNAELLSTGLIYEIWGAEVCALVMLWRCLADLTLEGEPLAAASLFRLAAMAGLDVPACDAALAGLARRGLLRIDVRGEGPEDPSLIAVFFPTDTEARTEASHAL